MDLQGAATSPTSVIEANSKPEPVDETNWEGSASDEVTHNRGKPNRSKPRKSPKSADKKMSRQQRRGQGSSAEARPTMKIPPTLKDSRKLFVGGLPPDITSEEFYNYFVRFGTVLDSVVMFDKATKRSRGFGFITYDDPNVCQHLLDLGQQAPNDDPNQNGSGYLEMRGKIIELKRAQPKQSAPSLEQPKRYRQEEARAYHSRPLVASSPSFQYHNVPRGEAHQQAEYNQYEIPSASSRYPVGPHGFPPMTPMQYYGPPPVEHQVTPQAALDLAHHMLFYSQLLATPTLMSTHPMVSPMLSPVAMGYEPQSYSEYFQPYSDPNNKDKPEPRSPIPPTKKTVSHGTAFQLGGGTFIPEAPSSPSQSPSISREGKNDGE